MRKATTVLIAVLALTMTMIAPATARDRSGDRNGRSISWAPIVQEISETDAPDPSRDKIGWSRLVRTENGLQAIVFARGLNPGGVYTFWWVAPHEFNDVTDPENPAPSLPGDVFVASGAAKTVGDSGIAIVRMRARTGQQGIQGFPPVGGAQWHPLTDPQNALVRVEIAYHGQADDPGYSDQWLEDFWTGSACPPNGSTNAAGQPHCPVYLAATHTP